MDSFFGMETGAVSSAKIAGIKHDLSSFYKINYLECSGKNYQKNVASLTLKSKFTFSHLCDVVEVLKIRGLTKYELFVEYWASLP